MMGPAGGLPRRPLLRYEARMPVISFAWLLVVAIGTDASATPSTFGPYPNSLQCEAVSKSMAEALKATRAPIVIIAKCVPLPAQ